MARVAEALGAAGETVEAIQTLALLAVAAVKAGLTEAGPADVEAAATVGTVAGLEAVWAVAADGALLTTAGRGRGEGGVGSAGSWISSSLSRKTSLH